MNFTPLTTRKTAIHASTRKPHQSNSGVVSTHICLEESRAFQKMARTQKIAFARRKNHFPRKKMARTPEKWLLPQKNRLNTEKMARTDKKSFSPQKNDLNAQKIIFTGKKSLIPVTTRLTGSQAFSEFIKFYLIYWVNINNVIKELKLNSNSKNQSPNLMKQIRGTRASNDEPP